MQPEDNRIVKVRVNASGKRAIGYVDLPAEHQRISDILNGPEDYLMLRQEERPLPSDERGIVAIFNEAISYVEALEEPERSKSLRREGKFHPVTAELKEPAVTIQAELFVPENGTIRAVLNGPRRFINLRNVRFINSIEKYGYLAVGKKQIIHLKT